MSTSIYIIIILNITTIMMKEKSIPKSEAKRHSKQGIMKNMNNILTCLIKYICFNKDKGIPNEYIIDKFF